MIAEYECNIVVEFKDGMQTSDQESSERTEFFEIADDNLVVFLMQFVNWL